MLQHNQTLDPRLAKHYPTPSCLGLNIHAAFYSRPPIRSICEVSSMAVGGPAYKIHGPTRRDSATTPTTEPASLACVTYRHTGTH